MDDQKQIKKEYSNGEITVVWQPGKCIHSGNCISGLPEVFQAKEKPWIKIEGARSDEIMAQVDQCPSGALSYFVVDNKEGDPEVESREMEVIPNGPLMIYGKVRIKYRGGETIERDKSTALCRCGSSGDKPFCDGTHRKIQFRG